MKKTKTKTDKKPRISVQKSEAVSLPLNDIEQAIIKKWREGEDENLLAIRFQAEVSAKQGVIATATVSDRGSSFEKHKLICAGFCAATGAKNTSFASRIFKSCVHATGLLHEGSLEVSAGHCAAISDALHAMRPQDEVEGLLITRLLALHFQGMSYMETSSNNAVSSEVREMHLNRSVKLFRLYNETLETLMRYRRKGEQKVIVQYVNVEQGGQAVVGNIQTGGGGNPKILRGTS